MNLEEEIRDGYKVSADMKKLWSVQMEILDEIDRVCKKHNITYYADGGTLLGAVRHKGFIPWDDDLDVQMYRDDLEKFCKVAKDELKPPFFLQTWETEEGFYPWLFKVRKSDTACFTEWEIENNPGGNRGIFVDIFPAYNVPDGKLAFAMQTVRLKRLKFLFECYQTDRALSLYGARKTSKRRLAQAIWKVCSIFTSSDKICRKFIKTATKVGPETKRLGYVTVFPGNKRFIWNREWFDGTVELPFEDRMIPCQTGYEKRLEQDFGDWRTPMQIKSMHSTLHYSCDVPYEEFLKTLRK